MVLASKDRESVSGDLLEEYRESIVPSLGASANAWYLRQVAGLVLRATWAWAGLVAAISLWRFLLDARRFITGRGRVALLGHELGLHCDLCVVRRLACVAHAAHPQRDAARRHRSDGRRPAGGDRHVGVSGGME
jgi:hypothetical protein